MFQTASFIAAALTSETSAELRCPMRWAKPIHVYQLLKHFVLEPFIKIYLFRIMFIHIGLISAVFWGLDRFTRLGNPATDPIAADAESARLRAEANRLDALRSDGLSRSYSASRSYSSGSRWVYD